MAVNYQSLRNVSTFTSRVLTTSSINTANIGGGGNNVSSITAQTVNFSTLTGSTITSQNVNVSTVTGSTVNSTGIMGVGTTAPLHALHMNGQIKSGYWTNACLGLTNGVTPVNADTTNGTSIQLTNAYNSYYFNMMTYGYTGGSGATIYITSDSAVGVTMARGANSWSTYSDARMKVDITPIEQGISSLLQLKPVSYLYETDVDNNDHVPYRVGFLTQDVEKVYPSLVQKSEGVPYTNKAGETFRPDSLSMTDMIPYIVNSIKELAQQNSTLQASVINLQSTVASLQNSA